MKAKLVKENLFESLSEDEVYEAIIDALQKSPEDLIAPGEEFENVKQYLLDLYLDGSFYNIDDVYKEVEYLTSPSGRSFLNGIKKDLRYN